MQSSVAASTWLTSGLLLKALQRLQKPKKRKVLKDNRERVKSMSLCPPDSFLLPQSSSIPIPSDPISLPKAATAPAVVPWSHLQSSP